MFNIDTNAPQLKAFADWANAYVTLDLKNVEPLLSKDFTWKIFPKASGLADQTKEEHIRVWGKVFASVTKFEPVVHEAIDAQGKAVIHCTGLFTTLDGTVIDYEVVFIHSFVEEDGELKILEIKEFSDPEIHNAFYALAGAPRAA